MQEPAEQTVVAGISPTAQIYLGSTATPLALPAPWHLHQTGGRRGSRCYFSLMEDPNFRRWPVAVWLGNDFSSQHSYNREKNEPGRFLGAFTWSRLPRG